MKQEINKFDVRIVQKHANPSSSLYIRRKIDQPLARYTYVARWLYTNVYV